MTVSIVSFAFAYRTSQILFQNYSPVTLRIIKLLKLILYVEIQNAPKMKFLSALIPQTENSIWYYGLDHNIGPLGKHAIKLASD